VCEKIWRALRNPPTGPAGLGFALALQAFDCDDNRSRLGEQGQQTRPETASTRSRSTSLGHEERCNV